MTKVLVTGASGFIGKKLTERLVARGDEVTCLVRGEPSRARLENLNVRFATGDVRDAAAVRAAVNGAETVYHLAGRLAAFTADELMAVNAGGFKNVAAACAERETPPVLLSVSSLAAVGPSPVDRPRTECDPPMPVSNYGRAKRAAEVIAQEYAARVPITIVRPPIVFGEGDQAMLGLFRSIARFGVHVAFGVGYSHYSFIHVDDLVDSLMLCADGGTRLTANGANGNSSPPPGYYFSADDERPTFGDLGELIARGLGRNRVRTLRSSGPVLLWSAAVMGELFGRVRRAPFILNFDKVREAKAGHWVCSAEKIRRELGFAPRASIADRLRQTADWYRRQQWL